MAPASSRGAGSSPARTLAAHSASEGPGRTGPRSSTDASVNMVTSSAVEFIHSSGDWSRRQTRPPPGGYGSTRCRSRGASPYSSGALAAMRSISPVPRGPAPTRTTAGRSGTRDGGWRGRGGGAGCGAWSVADMREGSVDAVIPLGVERLHTRGPEAGTGRAPQHGRSLRLCARDAPLSRLSGLWAAGHVTVDGKPDACST